VVVLHIVYFEPRVNSSTIQDFHFPELSRTLSFDFQDYPGPNLFSRTFQGLENQGRKSQDFPGDEGTLNVVEFS